MLKSKCARFRENSMNHYIQKQLFLGVLKKRCLEKVYQNSLEDACDGVFLSEALCLQPIILHPRKFIIYQFQRLALAILVISIPLVIKEIRVLIYNQLVASKFWITSEVYYLRKLFNYYVLQC